MKLNIFLEIDTDIDTDEMMLKQLKKKIKIAVKRVQHKSEPREIVLRILRSRKDTNGPFMEKTEQYISDNAKLPGGIKEVRHVLDNLYGEGAVDNIPHDAANGKTTWYWKAIAPNKINETREMREKWFAFWDEDAREMWERHDEEYGERIRNGEHHD